MEWKTEKPNLESAQILGWCVELLYTGISMYYDLIEGNTWRQGKQCWYSMDNVGIIGLNDAIILENSIYFLINKYFKNSSHYIPLMDIFHEAALKTGCLQNAVLLSSKESVMKFDINMYRTITNAKTTNYLYELPLKVAMQLAGINSNAFLQCSTILNEMGHIYQVKEDFLNLYRRNGNDIEENKCTWFVIECLQRANKEQKEIMRNCYGKKDPNKIQNIKDLYSDLGLDVAFGIYVERQCQIIRDHIEKLTGFPKDIFRNNLNEILLRIR
ncbi:farnesyl pyrophosphate synthase-like [Musca vetustissima]|uniref:farnesyl pyrophosphate synthase-like n=1 Tax=Musca vetustissima TaxID=27455 RepID=UPI002AB78EBC|nr:farnesyl pyrophosphate synthase-like [Musca vetustissima]